MVFCAVFSHLLPKMYFSVHCLLPIKVVFSMKHFPCLLVYFAGHANVLRLKLSTKSLHLLNEAPVS